MDLNLHLIRVCDDSGICGRLVSDEVSKEDEAAKDLGHKGAGGSGTGFKKLFLKINSHLQVSCFRQICFLPKTTTTKDSIAPI